MKKNFFMGFVVFFILSISLNLSLIFFFNERAEVLASNLLYIFSSAIFNATFEIVTPSISDKMFLIPIAITDGLIGGVIAMLIKLSNGILL